MYSAVSRARSTKICGSVKLLNAFEKKLRMPAAFKEGRLLFNISVLGKNIPPLEMENNPYITIGSKPVTSTPAENNLFPLMNKNMLTKKIIIISSYRAPPEKNAESRISISSYLVIFLPVAAVLRDRYTKTSILNICSECSIPANRTAGKGVINTAASR
jgi:hypothetical protein